MEIDLSETLSSINEVLQSIYKERERFGELSEEEIQDLNILLTDIHSFSFVIQKKLHAVATKKYEDSYWVWYYRSCFLRYNSGFSEKAYECAKKSIDVLSVNQDYFGASSRNYITLALENGDFELIDKEIARLEQNPYSESRILEGVAEDLHGKVKTGELSKRSEEILASRLK